MLTIMGLAHSVLMTWGETLGMAVDLNDGRHLLIEVRARSYPCDSVIDQALPTVGDGVGETPKTLPTLAQLARGSICKTLTSRRSSSSYMWLLRRRWEDP